MKEAVISRRGREFPGRGNRKSEALGAEDLDATRRASSWKSSDFQWGTSPTRQEADHAGRQDPETSLELILLKWEATDGF